MTKSVIKYSAQLGHSRLFQDFIYHPEKTKAFFRIDAPLRRAILVADNFHHRADIVEILSRQNISWQAPAEVLENIGKLLDKETVAVLVGQQPDLFGGPYMVLLKAMGAVKLARRLAHELSKPVVPIFWIASEDHDCREISTVEVFDTKGVPVRLAIDCEAKRIYPPVGDLAYDDSLDREIRRLCDILPDNDFKSEASDRLVQIYRPGKKIVDCFAEYMLWLVGKFGLPFFNPCDEQFKKMTAPLMGKIVSRRATLKQTLAKSESDLLGAGYHVQVQKAASSAHIFFHAPERTAIQFRDGKFMAGDRSFTEKELVDTIEADPVNFSPDALTRPLVQSFAFPTASVIGGPAEVAYYAQIMPLFELFHLPAPLIVARPSLTIVEKRFEDLMNRHEIAFESLAGDIEAIINRVLGESFPEGINQHLSNMRLLSGDELRKLKNLPLIGDYDLTGIVDKTGDNIEHLLKDLGQKIFSTHKKKYAVEREKLYRLQQNLFPNRGLAERSIAPVYPVSRYGSAVIDFIYENMSLDETGHRLLMLSEYHG